MQTVQTDKPGRQTPDGQIVESTTEARQGVTGHNVRYVLGWGTVGVVICFAIVAFFTLHG